MKKSIIFAFQIFILASTLLISSYAFSNDNSKSIEYDKSQFRGWIVDFSKDAEKNGISNQTIYYFMKDAQFIPKVIELDRSQPDKTKTFEQYEKAVIPKYRIQRARKQLEQNRDVLDEIGRKYGVQPRFIVALWAMESDFGNNMGGFSIVNSLATLAYEGRRAEFFRNELINALKIIDQDHIKFKDMKGSWAGAMGQTQFMPSSFLELAVDYNKDGKRDIWGTKDDVFASIANYLSKSGWNDELTWGREVKLPKNFDSEYIGRDIEKTLPEWEKLGVRKIDGGKLPNKPDLKASLVKPEDDKNRTFLVYSNYKTLLKWNRSLYFATAVGILSDGMIN